MTNWDWADVMIWDAALGEVERVEALGRLSDMLTAASLTATAFHEPGKLAAERGALRDLGRLPAGVPEPQEVAAVTEAMLARVALAERVARRARRRGEDVPFLRVMRGD